jgi:hypothetical protein
MMQSNAALLKVSASMLLGARTYANGGAATDIVDSFTTTENLRQAQKRKQRVIEWPTFFPLAHCKCDVRYTVNLDHGFLEATLRSSVA